MNRRLAHTTAMAAALAALALGGCGSSGDKGDPIPAQTRQELDKQLSSIEDRFDFGGGACSDIAQNQKSVETALDGLSSDIDPQVRDALRDGFDRLFQLTAEQCDEQKGQETDTETTESAPAPEPEPTTPTTPSETTPTPTTPDQQQDKGKQKDNGGTGGGADGGAVPDAGGGGGGGTVSPGDG